ncbi:3-hydroxyacyl-CoA dehydrogenase family protein, partial [Shimia sp.]|uniref:3-hydroxyacyl-CoA dehydrogenase n=1 Tax=Shimia sp. TaxID=1954381 RepID=UPI003566A2F4
DLFASLGEVARPGAVLAASTAGSDLAELAQASGRGGAVLGLYFRFPAHATRLVEIAVGEDCAPDTVATALGLARRLGKVAVRTGSDAGIGAPMMAAYLHAADRMLEAGATPYLIDEAMVAYGMATGPYRAQDLVGLAPGRQGPADAATPVGIAGRLCAAGRFGRRVGKGYYLYEKGAEQGRADPEVIALIRAERERLGITARRFNPEEIQRRCLLAMVNQGARLLRQGVARCPSDIDAVMLHGYGFPRWRGGPMMAADLSGLLHLKNDLAVFAGEEAEFWTPDPVFDELIKNGETFDSLNG